MKLVPDRKRRDGSPYAEDLALAARCTSDQAAWQTLFHVHGPQVYALARRLVGAEEAEDVVQEVFTQVFKSIDSYRGEAALSSWMHRITVRCAMRAMRRKKPARGAALTLVPADDSVANPERQVQQNEALRDVRALLQRLSPRRRTVFLLHEVEGFTLPEAAALIGISVTAAKKCVWRARRDIDRLMRKDPALQRTVEEWRDG